MNRSVVQVECIEYVRDLNVVMKWNWLFDEDEKISLVIVTIVYRMMMNTLELSRNVSQSLIVVHDEVVMMEIALFLSFFRLSMWFEEE